ncbi:MAG: hypothetical protein ABSA82_10840 [Thermacetogeniaceae bacterium]|jgi:hypothetical protein
MTSICSDIAGVVTRWVERNAPYAINTMANLTYKAVRTGCDLTRKTAVAADDLINKALGRIKSRL